MAGFNDNNAYDFDKFLDYDRIIENKQYHIDNNIKPNKRFQHLDIQMDNYIKWFNHYNGWGFKVENGFDDFWDKNNPGYYCIEKWCPKFYEEYLDYWCGTICSYVNEFHADMDILP